ncbi:MAG TPA: hypothetical protein VJQ45_11030 [Ktedonobacterales bacterium]|nr:hypothetical protein [Ktedonobacterales bacterium]
MSSSGMGTTAGQTGMAGATGQTGTGASNIVYDVVSVLYHSLESASTTQQYIRDAQQAGNNDLVNFFQQVEKVNRQCADQAQQLLAQQLQNQPSH